MRGVGEWLSKHFAGGGKYKPTVHQLPFTRMLDFAVLRASGLPCFGSFERALRLRLRVQFIVGMLFSAN